MIEIPLSKQGKHKGKYVAIVDEKDKDLAELNWFVHKMRQLTYVRCAKSDAGFMHRVIMERMRDGQKLEKGEYVDHINGDTLDNRRENLRVATRSQNQANRGKQKNNKTGYKGVYKTRNGFWSAIKYAKKSYYLGVFDTEEDAYKAYCEKAKELHGAFWNAG